MKTLILAAGLGSRLKHKTRKIPKALVPVNGKPIIQYQIGNLLKAGLKDLIIVIGYQGDQIRGYIKDTFPQLSVKFIENSEYEISNSSYSFWQAKDLVTGSAYLHLNCDIIFSQALLQKVMNSPHENAIAVRKDLDLTDKMENVVLDGDRIVQMTLENVPEASGKAFGLAKLSAESTAAVTKILKDYLDRRDKNQHYYGIIRQVIKVLAYRAVVTDRYNLQEINTVEDYETVEKMIVNNNFGR